MKWTRPSLSLDKTIVANAGARTKLKTEWETVDPDETVRYE